MTNISHVFTDLFRPAHLVVIYKNDAKEDCRYYIETFPLDTDGRPLAPHPLSETEARSLAKLLQEPDGRPTKGQFLQAEGVLPSNVLYTSHRNESSAVWFTPSRIVPLLFQSSLHIPCGPAAIPPLIWKATAKSLSVYACKDDVRPTAVTNLCHAPFFNLHDDGDVCMGTVNVSIPADCSLERFMSLWESYFFGSYFAHLLIDSSPVEGNVVELWQELVGTDRAFPLNRLKPTSITVKQLLA